GVGASTCRRLPQAYVQLGVRGGLRAVRGRPIDSSKEEPFMRHAFILTLIALAVASPAQAHFALFHRPVQTRAFYVPIAVVVTPVPAPAVRVPCPEPLLGSAAPVVAPAPPAATPLPSPPSSGPLRPTPAPQPRSSPPVNEGAATSAKVSTSFYEALPTANAAAPRAGSLFSVTFWNLSNTPLSLHVAGQMR